MCGSKKNLCYKPFLSEKIATQRLSKVLDTLKMGGGADEHLLITLNIREPVKILDQIRKDHPELRVTFYKLEQDTKVPDGALQDGQTCYSVYLKSV